MQDLSKYSTPKYRLVVRFTNARVITQITYATLKGDRVLCQADSKELSQWGLTAGHTSYAAAYATGLLISRRLLTQLGLGQTFKGKKELDGAPYNVASEAETYKQDRRAFRAILDIGIITSTIGNRVYGALKGACDGGINVPHNVKKFPGYFVEEGKKKGQYKAEAHKERIFGTNIETYRAEMEKTLDKQTYTNRWGLWHKCLEANKVKTITDVYKKVHAGILADPKRKTVKKVSKQPVYVDKERTKVKNASKAGFYVRKARKISLAERKAKVAKKVAIALK